jgi:hypothetical protein
VAERYAPHRLAEIAGLCEVTKPPTRLRDGDSYVIFGLRFTAEDFPRLSSISNFDLLSFIERTQAGALDGRDTDPKRT